MSAAEVLEDARQVAEVLRQNLLRAEPIVQLPVPFSTFLAALDHFNREQLNLVRRRLAKRLAA